MMLKTSIVMVFETYAGQQQDEPFTSSNKPRGCGQRAYSADARNKPKCKKE
jgi:hypothetical protein